jgi:hypothetical protein
MRAIALVLAALALAAQARATGYNLDPGASLEGETLRVAPRVSGPPGERLRYEIAVRREGAGNSADNRQSGTLVLDARGAARLATTVVSVQPGESFSVNVKIYEGQRLAVERSVSGP